MPCADLELGLYAVLGIVCAVVGVVFTRVLYAMEDLFDRLWRWSESWRPAALGGLLGRAEDFMNLLAVVGRLPSA